MSRSNRLFEIIQILRVAPRPITAADLALKLEVSTRTIYRNIASLQAMQTPMIRSWDVFQYPCCVRSSGVNIN